MSKQEITGVPSVTRMTPMEISLTTNKDAYTEQEAAAALGITLDRLHMLLDQNIFNDGSTKPTKFLFRATDLVLIDFWKRTGVEPKIMRMPRR